MNPDAQLTYLKLSNLIGKGEVLTVKDNSEIKPLTVTGTRYIDFLVPGLDNHGCHDVVHVGYKLWDN